MSIGESWRTTPLWPLILLAFSKRHESRGWAKAGFSPSEYRGATEKPAFGRTRWLKPNPEKIGKKFSLLLIGLVTIYGDSLHATMCREVVVYRFVLGAAVVPNGYAVGLPLEATGIFHRGDVCKQHLQ